MNLEVQISSYSRGDCVGITCHHSFLRRNFKALSVIDHLYECADSEISNKVLEQNTTALKVIGF